MGQVSPEPQFSVAVCWSHHNSTKSDTKNPLFKLRHGFVKLFRGKKSALSLVFLNFLV